MYGSFARVPTWVAEIVATVHTRVVLQHRRTGHFWLEGERWVRDREQARSFVSEHDAYLAAYHECSEEPSAYETAPLALLEAR